MWRPLLVLDQTNCPKIHMRRFPWSPALIWYVILGFSNERTPLRRLFCVSSAPLIWSNIGSVVTSVGYLWSETLRALANFLKVKIWRFFPISTLLGCCPQADKRNIRDISIVRGPARSNPSAEHLQKSPVVATLKGRFTR